MTDKVQKIREEVEKLHGNPYYMMAVKDVLEILNMQEEPVSKDLEEAMNRAADETRLTKAKNGQPFFSEVDFNLGFSNGAQCQKQQTVDKACDWLLDNWSHYVTVDNGIVKCYNNMIDDLREYISELCR